MADEYVLQTSMDLKGEETFPVQNVRHLRVVDSQNGSYSTGELNYDLASISNSGMYVDWKQSYIEIPVCIRLLTTNDAGAAVNVTPQKLLLGLKNGYFSLIHAMSLTLSNMSVINLQPYMSGRISYELMSNFTQEDADKALQYGFFPDSLESYANVAAPASNGIIGGHQDKPENYTEVNSTSRPKRQELLFLEDGANAIYTDTARISGVEHISSVTGAGNEVVARIMARIPMSILHDYFLQCPLTKNSVYSLTVQTNCPSTFSHAIDDQKWDVARTPYTTTHGFNPISVGNANQFTSAVTNASFELTIARPSAGNFACPVQQTSLYIHVMKMSPEAEKQYLAEPVKTFRHMEVQAVRVPAEPNDANVSRLITNSLSRLRKLVILPFYSDAMTSPFTNFASGSLSSPYAHLKNFNVQISGIPVYPQPLNRNTEFYRELLADTLNGGIVHSQVNTCQISEYAYQRLGGAIVVDLSRHDAATDDMAQSVLLEYQYAGKVACELLVYCYYEKEVSINAELGNLVL